MIDEPRDGDRSGFLLGVEFVFAGAFVVVVVNSASDRGRFSDGDDGDEDDDDDDDNDVGDKIGEERVFPVPLSAAAASAAADAVAAAMAVAATSGVDD